MDSIENEEIIDPITMEPIDKDRIISFEQNNKVFYFDIDSLYRYIKHGKEINPLTRIPLDESTLKKTYDYGKKYLANITVYGYKKKYSISADSYIRLGDLIIEVCRGISDSILDNILRLNFLYNGKSIYENNLDDQLNNLTQDFNIDLNIDYYVYRYPIHTIIVEKLYRYSIDHDIEWLETYIPPRFKHPKPIIEKSTIELNNIFYTHLFNYNGDSSCNLIHILNQVKMTSDEAHCIDFTIKKLNLHFTIIEKLRHLVYSRVVDKFRLRTGYGPESYYYRDIYQEPDYTIAQNKLF